MEQKQYYEGLKNPDAAVVQKSHPLKMLAHSSLSLCELKILDMYCGRINSRNSDIRTVKFKKGDIENALGIKRIRKEELKARVSALFMPITLDDWCTEQSEGFVMQVLFERIACTKVGNQWEVEMTCTENAKELFFNLENIGYIKYRLKNVLKLTSRYSYNLFLHLIDSPKKTMRIELPMLKNILGCKSEKYTEFKYFNRDILKKTCNEINEKTDINVEYKSYYTHGNTIAGIEFTVSPKNEIDFTKFRPLDTSENIS